MSVDNTTLYLHTKNSIFCQGDMFRPYKVILRPSKKTDPRVGNLGSVFLKGLRMTL